MKTITDIEREFEEKFGGSKTYFYFSRNPVEVKEFIRSAYKAGLERAVEVVKLLELAKCPDPDCDNKGSIACRISDDEWEQQQCQWCDERKKTLAAIEEEVKKVIE